VHLAGADPQKRRLRGRRSFPQVSSTACFSPIFSLAESANSLRKGCEIAAEKDCGKSQRKSGAKHVEKPWIFCGFPMKSLCRTLRNSCGEAADKQRRIAGSPVYNLWI